MKKTLSVIYISCLVLTTGFAAGNKTVQTNVKPVLSEEEQRNFDFNFYEGLRLKDEGKLQEAYDSLLTCMAIDSLDAGLLSEISLMQQAKGETEQSLKTMEKARALDPENWWFNTHLIRLYTQQKKYDDAIRLGEYLIGKYPYKEATYSMLIPLYKETGQLNKAVNLYEQLERITGVNEKISFDKFRLYMAMHKGRKANLEIDKLIHKYPFESRYKILKGDVLMQQNQKSKAYEIYMNVLKEDPQNPYVYISLSDYYKQSGDAEKAMEYVISALKSDQLDVDSKIEILGQHIEHLIRANEKIDDTESLFKLLVDSYPLEEAVYRYYAAFLQYMKRENEAASVYESMLAINSKNSQTWLNLMQISLGKQEYERVINICDSAILAAEEPVNFYLYKGIALQLLKNPTEASNAFREGISILKEGEKPGLKSDLYSYLAEAYFNLEKPDSAYLSYEEAIKYNPDNVPALNNYAYYLSLEKKDLQKAERMSARTVEKEPRNSTYLDTYAWIFFQQENYSLAKFYIERAIDNLKKDQDPGVLFDHYGDILWMSNHQDKALEMWQKAYDSGYQTDELKAKIENKGWRNQTESNE